MKLERITKFFKPFHKVHDDPKQNYGVGAMQVGMYVKGEEGVIQFTFSTGMYLPKTYKWWAEKGLHLNSNRPDYMAYDLGYHAKTPQYEGQTPMGSKCDWFEGACYYDGSTLQADEILTTLMNDGEDAVWLELEKIYKERFIKQ